MPNPDLRKPNFYASGGLDRAHERRGDPTWLAERLADPRTLLVPVWRQRNLFLQVESPRARFLRADEAGHLVEQADGLALLGLYEETAYIALDLTPLEAPEPGPSLTEDSAFQDIRAVGPLLAHWEGALLAYARGMMYWHSRHRFCGLCGHPTESLEAGHLRRCCNPACGTPHFPRTDPAVIMLVHDGERCLMGRQAAWPAGMHSTLAGFVEPGESLEDAVAREVEEESGIRVDEVRYHSSQPWPFPSSIMLGFHARYASGELTVNPDELESARWFSRDELRNSPEDDSLRLPRKDSIARRLIEDWLAEPG